MSIHGTMKRLLIVDRVHPFLSESMEKEGWCCTTDMTFTRESFMALPDDFAGLIIRSRFVVDAAVIDSKPSLQFIVRIGSGVENIDVEYAEKKGVHVISTPEGNANAVAEHCLGLLLAALRHIPNANQEVRNGQWLREKNKGSELQSRTFGIIGYGHTGPAFARLLTALGCKVYAYDRYNPYAGDENAEMVSLNELLQKCDVISLHINYIEDNKYFINDNLMQKVKNNFILINSCRGLVVNTSDLIRNLKNGKITCACLDVLEYESPKLKIPAKEEWADSLKELASLENVILTPHIGGQTLDAELKHAKVAVQKILNLYQN